MLRALLFPQVELMWDALCDRQVLRPRLNTRPIVNPKDDGFSVKRRLVVPHTTMSCCDCPVLVNNRSSTYRTSVLGVSAVSRALTRVAAVPPDHSHVRVLVRRNYFRPVDDSPGFSYSKWTSSSMPSGSSSVRFVPQSGTE